MKDRAAQLYKEVILQHSKHPYHYQKPDQADHVIEAYNQFCGDHFHLYLSMKGDQITQAFFHGYGCAISKASTSILTQMLEGMSIKELPAMVAEFQQVVHPADQEEAASQMDEFLAFAAARKFPGRDKCALLPWTALEEWLTDVDS
ncbi:MAG: Fe-S cluster assembly sulfur transfer protein SufU [Bacteroidota bacterium]